MTVYTLSSRVLRTLAKELTAATRVIRSSSNEFSTALSDSAKCKQTKDNTKMRYNSQADVDHLNGWTVSVTYWLKRCTCVNKRKQVDVKQKYNQDTDGLSQLDIRCQRSETSSRQRAWALSDPRLSNPSQDAEEVLLWSEELGVNM